MAANGEKPMAIDKQRAAREPPLADPAEQKIRATALDVARGSRLLLADQSVPCVKRLFPRASERKRQPQADRSARSADNEGPVIRLASHTKAR